MSEIAKPRWVDHGINIQSCSRVPSAAPLKYDSITLWDKMNQIHHFDVFVRFVSRYWHGLPLGRVKNPKGNEKCRNPEMQRGQPEKSIKCHCLMVSPSPIFDTARKIVLEFFTFRVYRIQKQNSVLKFTKRNIAFIPC